MTKEQAIEIMKQSKTVAEWNENREEVRKQCTPQEWSKLYWEIDATGLIVSVLGRDENS